MFMTLTKTDQFNLQVMKAYRDAPVEPVFTLVMGKERSELVREMSVAMLEETDYRCIIEQMLAEAQIVQHGNWKGWPV